MSEDVAMKTRSQKWFDIICLSIIGITVLCMIIAYIYTGRISFLHHNDAYDWGIVEPDSYHGVFFVSFGFLPFIFKEVAVYFALRYLLFEKRRNSARTELNKYILCMGIPMLLLPIIGMVTWRGWVGWKALTIGKSALVFLIFLCLCIFNWYKTLTYWKYVSDGDEKSYYNTTPVFVCVGIVLICYVSLSSMFLTGMNRTGGESGYVSVSAYTQNTTWHTADETLVYTCTDIGYGHGTLTVDGTQHPFWFYIGSGSDESGSFRMAPENSESIFENQLEHWRMISCYETPTQVVFVYEVKETTFFEVGQTFRVFYDKPLHESK